MDLITNMTHDIPLPECERRWKEFDKHVDESVDVRDNVSKSCQQILTLEKAHEATMQDIKDIKADIATIKDALWGIRVWILSAAVAGLLVLSGQALYFGGYIKQIDINTEKWKTHDLNGGR